MNRSSVAPTLQKLALPLSMLALFVIALYVRLHFLLIRGGLEADQLDWGMRVYYGGISQTYLSMRDAILTGHAEPRLWSYMPGYPAFLAVIDLLGFKTLIAVRAVQTVLDAASIGPLFYVVTRLTRSGSLAAFAASVYAVSPWWAQGAGYLLGESLVPALVIFVLAGMTWTREHPRSLFGWAALGLFCATLPFFRSEMILLVAPLILWAVMVGLPGRRASAAAIVVLAFAAPILAWCLRNYLIHGQFALVPPVGWYGMWSGLGQVANDFGYLVNDQRANELLQSKGISWHTPTAEAYWKSKYLQAWNEHPGHVFKTILFRMNFILSSWDYGYVPLEKMCDIVYRWFAWATLLAILWLLWKKRWPEAFLIAGPMAFALLTLGFVYVEARYVRYAGLSYLLGFPVLAALVVDFAGGRSRAMVRFASIRSIKAAAGAAGIVAVIGYLAGQQASLNRAECQSILVRDADILKPKSAIHPDIVPQPLAFEPAIPTALATFGPQGLNIQAKTRNDGTYLMTAALNTNGADAAVIRYRIRLMEGDLTIGTLSGNQKIFLSNKSVSGAPESVQSSELRTPVELASLIVLSASNPTELGSEFQIQDLEITFLCLENPIEFAPLYLLGRRSLRANLCNRQTIQR